jgi:nicotinate-nucleotide pyrophosphorylase (carboxylating)
VDLALAEDLGVTGDRTSRALIPADQAGRASFVARKPGVVAGLPAAAIVCAAVDPKLTFEPKLEDGVSVERGTTLAIVSGPLRSILAAERTALNFLQRLSGIASLTREYVETATGFPAKILDTRKTTPGWRLLEKYAVRMGGGSNHRMGLYDGILIKDNHLAGLGGDVQLAVETARSAPGNDWLPVEVEVETLEQLDEALATRADIVLLDNMSPDLLREAVKRRDARSPETRLEASGGVNLARVRDIAATGVDRISVGAITHSAPALDIALDYLPLTAKP